MKELPVRARVDIDFARRSGRPLSKERLSIYNSGLVPIERYRRDAEFFTATGAESLRIDLGWGAEWMPWQQQPVTIADDGAVAYHFEETDDLVALLTSTHTRPYWSYCYVPIAARPDGGDWRTMADDQVWVDLVRAYVEHERSLGSRVGYHEVYNEPDLRDERTGEAVFYSGSLEDYLELYRATSQAIREADPSAFIGGPALAFPLANPAWLDAFLEAATTEQLPLDFLSFHHYGTHSLDGSLDVVDRALAPYELPYLETHLNEYNAFPIDYPQGGTQDTNLLAAAFAADLPRLIDRPGLTKTSWAQFLDSGQGNFSGMVTIDGAPKPVFEVFDFYQRMPLARRTVTVDGPAGVGAIASSSVRGGAAIVWNRHFAALEVEVVVRSLAFDTAIVRIIGPDGTTSSQLTLVDGALTVSIPQAGVALIQSGELEDPPGERIVQRAFRRRPAQPTDGWVDVDEVTGSLQWGVDSAKAVLVCGADLAVAELIDWEWSIRDAAGDEREGSLVVRVIDDTGERDLVFGSSPGTVDWAALAPARDRQEGHLRVLAALTNAQRGTFATLRPVVTK